MKRTPSSTKTDSFCRFSFSCRADALALGFARTSSHRWDKVHFWVAEPTRSRRFDFAASYVERRGELYSDRLQHSVSVDSLLALALPSVGSEFVTALRAGDALPIGTL